MDSGNICRTFKNKSYLLKGQKSEKNQFKEIRLLGQGQYGRSFLAKRKDMKKGRFVKKVLFCGSEVKDQEKEIGEEIEKLGKLEYHENLLPYLDWYFDENEGGRLCVVTKYGSEKESLEDLLFYRKTEALEGYQIFQIMYELMNGLLFLHHSGIIHRNIKCSNIIMDNQTLRISDFSLKVQMQNKLYLSPLLATLQYSSPESLDGLYTTKSDIWSLGVVFYKLLSGGQMPFVGKGLNQLSKNIRNGNCSKYPHPEDTLLPIEMYKIVGSMLRPNPLERGSAEDIMEILMKMRPFYMSKIIEEKFRVEKEKEEVGEKKRKAGKEEGRLNLSVPSDGFFELGPPTKVHSPKGKYSKHSKCKSKGNSLSPVKKDRESKVNIDIEESIVEDKGIGEIFKISDFLFNPWEKIQETLEQPLRKSLLFDGHIVMTYIMSGNPIAKYWGQHRNGHPHGFGKAFYHNGVQYLGYWDRGVKHGNGKLIWFDGDKYDGHFAFGKKDGVGVYVSSKGIIYTGEFSEDLKEGFGLTLYPNGDSYEGGYVSDLQEGNGVYTYFASDTRYVGSFHKGSIHGKGTIYYSHGGVFQGNFAANNKHGVGTYLPAKGAKTKTQNWVNGKMIP